MFALLRVPEPLLLTPALLARSFLPSSRARPHGAGVLALQRHRGEVPGLARQADGLRERRAESELPALAILCVAMQTMYTFR